MPTGTEASQTKQKSGGFRRAASGILAVILVLTSLATTAFLLIDVFMNNSDPGSKGNETVVDYAMMDRYDMAMTNTIASSLDGILSLKKVYWLSDADQVAPEPLLRILSR